MKKTLPLANAPLPKFASDEAAAEYFAAHSMAGVWDRLPAAEPAKLSKALTSSIQERHSARKSPISIRLGPEQIVAAKKIASAKSVGYQTQLRMWIAEGIRREGKA
jgi:predicted DNA binding CopG/RHH family protein